MRDKADYARKGIARGRSCVTLQYAGGILMVAPNPSSALHKISEIYDRIAFAAVGRYNEYENLRKAGVTYADITGYQFDRHDVTARGIANCYAQTLGTIFTESIKPFEVEIVVAEVGAAAGGRPDLPDHVRRLGDRRAGLRRLRRPGRPGVRRAEGTLLRGHVPGRGVRRRAGRAVRPGNGERNEVAATQLEVAILDRARDHRTFRRIRAARLEELHRREPAAARRRRSADAIPATAPADAGSDGQARRPRPRRPAAHRTAHRPRRAQHGPRQRDGRYGQRRRHPRPTRPGRRPTAGCWRARPCSCGASAMARASSRRVCAGSMTASMTPRSTARCRPPAVASCSAASSVSASCSCSGGTEASVRRCRMRTAATAPITATSAPGQANTRVAPSEREFIAM